MTYTKTSELPATIRDVLPQAAQELYMQVYNEAMLMRLAASDQANSRDSMAHQLAWDTMTREFVHDPQTGQWYRKGEEPAPAAANRKGFWQRFRGKS